MGSGTNGHLATFMELLDTSIAMSRCPHRAGLGRSFDETTWVLTSYLVANAVVLPMSAWLSSRPRAKALLHDQRGPVHRDLILVRHCPRPELSRHLPRSAGIGGGGLAR